MKIEEPEFASCSPDSEKLAQLPLHRAVEKPSPRGTGAGVNEFLYTALHSFIQNTFPKYSLRATHLEVQTQALLLEEGSYGRRTHNQIPRAIYLFIYF